VMLLVIDIGLSNLASVKRAFEIVGGEVVISAASGVISTADAIVLPGVGAFADGMSVLDKRNLISPLRHASKSGIPILGICLGMQLLAGRSEEGGSHEGLGLIEGDCIRLEPGQTTDRVPNIGWCDIKPVNRSILFNEENSTGSYYFAHSYYLDCDEKIKTASIEFGGGYITAAIEYNNIFGVQFHPEKSQDFGLDILSAFIRRIKN
jgi:glutamine amidotransferase